MRPDLVPSGRMSEARTEVASVDRVSWNARELLANDQWRKAVSQVVWQEFLDATVNCDVQDIRSRTTQLLIGNIPRLRVLAEEVRAELQRGTGVVWLRNQNETPVPHESRKLFFLLLCAGFANTVDTYGTLYDVVDQGKSHTTAAVPVSQTRASTAFHTDSSALDTTVDAIGLLCMRPARSGGASLIVDAAAVHERMRRERPDLLPELYRDYIRDVVTPGTDRHLEAVAANRFPVYAHGPSSTAVSFRYMRYWIERGHERIGDALGSKSIEAFDCLDRLLEDPDQCVQFRLDAGDILLVNNHVVAHNRTEYVDWEDAERRRWMVRIWLNIRSVS
jgi:alpha-ketoglutarate-dependent taurine dioxygenase